jgi:hypothetical protein
MRTTLTLDDDVAAIVEAERARTGETVRATVNRLLRRGARAPSNHDTPPALPELPGQPVLDVSDVSALLATLDEERRAQRAVP